jgi:hypothetical protein
MLFALFSLLTLNLIFDFIIKKLIKLLTIDPLKRISTQQALDDLYFKEEPRVMEE